MGGLTIFFILFFLIIVLIIGALVCSVDGASEICDNKTDSLFGSFGSYVDSFGQSSGS